MMKIGHIMFVLAILLVSCVPETPEEPEDIIAEIDEPEIGPLPEEAVVEMPGEEPWQEIEVVEEKENLIGIKEEGFDPDKITINQGEEVVWISDAKPRMIACYDGSDRVFLGEKTEEQGARTVYTFKKTGTYLCIDAIYGLRSNIIVKKNFLPVGNVIGLTNNDIEPHTLLLFVGLMLFLTLLAVWAHKESYA